MMVDKNFAHELKHIISAHYNIGDLLDFEQIHLGSVNQSFIIRTAGKIKKKSYFFRKYTPGKTKNEIEFEHSIITHLKKNRFALAAGLIHTKEGKTVVTRNKGREHFYAVFDILPGKDRYSWINPDCRRNDIETAGTVLAQFHSKIFDLEPDQKRCEPQIIDLLPQIAKTVSRYAKEGGKSPFNSCLRKRLDIILTTIDQTLNGFVGGIEGYDYNELIQMVIHCDYHPGNLKFQQNAITGLFDFDWSKKDVRCFDVALAITYFCATWEKDQNGRYGNGSLHMEKVSIFFQAYQKTFITDPGPLNDPELKYLPHMIKAAGIYIVNWVILNFHSREIMIDPCNHIKYLQHYTRFLTWLEKKCHFSRLEKLFL